MKIERDPRETPIKGDVFSAPGVRTPEITVTDSNWTGVSWTSPGIPDAFSDSASWRRWARTAIIIKRGDQP